MKIYFTILHCTDKYTFIMTQLQQSNFNSEFQGIKNWAFVLINFPHLARFRLSLLLYLPLPVPRLLSPGFS